MNKIKRKLLSIIILTSFNLVFISNSISQEPLFVPERSRFDAMQSRDSATLDKLIHLDLIYVHSNGLVESKAKHIENIMSGYIQYKQIVNEELKIRYYDDSVITNGVIKVKGVLNLNEFDIKLRYSAFYIKEKGDWLLVNWQSTKLSE